MSFRPKIKQDDTTTIDLPLDAETLNGKTAEQWLSEYVDIASDQTIAGVKAFSTSVWASISWIGLINDDDAPAWQFNPAGLYFYPDRSQILENKLIAYNSTSGLFVLGTNFNYTYSIPANENSTAIATTEWVTTKINTALSSISDITNIVNNTTKIAETNFGGFSAGKNSSATTGGGAVGSDASTLSGGAVGSGANSTTGGAVGLGAYTTTGFAGGYMAKASANGAVQLGEGVNQDANTLQFRGYKIVDANGNVVAPANEAKQFYRHSLNSSNNLNDIQEEGYYYWTSSQPTNSPCTYGIMIVMFSSSSKYNKQIVFRQGSTANASGQYTSDEIYLRSENGEGTWTDWVLIPTLRYLNQNFNRKQPASNTLGTKRTTSTSGSFTIADYTNYSHIILRYYPSSADYWVETDIEVKYLTTYPGTSSAHRVITTQTADSWCNFWFSSHTTLNYRAGQCYQLNVYAY